jgi:hypothetical protein
LRVARAHKSLKPIAEARDACYLLLGACCLLLAADSRGPRCAVCGCNIAVSSADARSPRACLSFLMQARRPSTQACLALALTCSASAARPPAHASGRHMIALRPHLTAACHKLGSTLLGSPLESSWKPTCLRGACKAMSSAVINVHLRARALACTNRAYLRLSIFPHCFSAVPPPPPPGWRGLSGVYRRSILSRHCMPSSPSASCASLARLAETSAWPQLLGRSSFPKPRLTRTALATRVPRSTALLAHLVSLLHAILALAPDALVLADATPVAILAPAPDALVLAEG